MKPRLNFTGAAAVGLTAIFTNVDDAVAQEQGYIHEPINGAIANIKCSTAFPDGQPPNPRFIAWVDTTYFHGGGLSPTTFVLMTEEERQQALNAMNPLNRPLFLDAADIYDDATDKNAALISLISEAHDFPKSRWDNMAERCRDLN